MNFFNLSVWLVIFVLVVLLMYLNPPEGFIQNGMYSTPGFLANGKFSTQWGQNLPWKLMGEKMSDTLTTDKVPQKRDPEGIEYADVSKPENLVNSSGQEHLARGQPHKQRQLVGWRWRYGYRPQFWRNFPLKPIWTPPRQPSATGNIYWTTNLPKKLRFKVAFKERVPQLYPLCVEFARRKCAGNHYAHYCFRRNYSKCLAGFAI